MTLKLRTLTPSILFLGFCLGCDSQKPPPSSGTPEQPDSRPASAATSVEPELDLPKLLLRTPRQVEKIIGRPDEDTDPDPFAQGYSWGFLDYYDDSGKTKGRLRQVTYSYRARPRSVREAMERVGLQLTSEPRISPLGSYFWRTDDGPPYVCCGFVFSNIVIDENFENIFVVAANRASVEESSGARTTSAPFDCNKKVLSGSFPQPHPCTTDCNVRDGSAQGTAINFVRDSKNGKDVSHYWNPGAPRESVELTAFQYRRALPGRRATGQPVADASTHVLRVRTMAGERNLSVLVENTSGGCKVSEVF
jgi:hypothetical protein